MHPTPDSQTAHLRGTARLLYAAAEGVSGIVEQMHGTIQALPLALGGESEQRTRGLTGFVYANVHRTIRLAGHITDSVLAALPDTASTAPTLQPVPTYQAVLNGVFGDYLARTDNPLALAMALHGPHGVVDPRTPHAHADDSSPPTRLLLLIHGLCMSDRGWRRSGHDHGAGIARDLAYHPLYLRYNSGIGVARNGEELASLLETLFTHWPAAVEELAIVGYSMGGLLARSALHHARESGHRWPRHLRRLVFLGTPHHGTLLERSGAYIDLGVQASPYSRPLAQLTKARSEGITDLRHGKVHPRAEHIALPPGVDCYAIAAVTAKRRASHGRLGGDGLVSLASALGRHHDPARDLGIPPSRQWVGHEMGHLDLLSDPNVYAQLREYLATPYAA